MPRRAPCKSLLSDVYFAGYGLDCLLSPRCHGKSWWTGRFDAWQTSINHCPASRVECPMRGNWGGLDNDQRTKCIAWDYGIGFRGHAFRGLIFIDFHVIDHGHVPWNGMELWHFRWTSNSWSKPLMNSTSYDRRMLANVLTTVAPYFDNDQRMRLLNQMRISSVSLSTYTSERDSRNRISSSTARSDRTNSDDKGGDMFNSSIADHSRNANVEEEPEKGVEEVRLSVPVQDPEEREERSAPSFEAHNRVHFAETFRTMEIWNQSSTLDWREAMWIAGERTNPPTVACDHAQLRTDFLLEFFVAGSAWSIFCLQDPANAPGKCQLAVYQGHQEPPQEILQHVSFFIRGCLLLTCICWANLREVAMLDMIDAVWMLGTHQSLTSWN